MRDRDVRRAMGRERDREGGRTVREWKGAETVRDGVVCN